MPSGSIRSYADFSNNSRSISMRRISPVLASHAQSGHVRIFPAQMRAPRSTAQLRKNCIVVPHNLTKSFVGRTSRKQPSSA
jgi:hypothetical protein